MNPAAVAKMFSGMAGMGQAAPSSAYLGGATVTPNVTVEAMRINQTDWKLYALLGFGALLIWKVVR